jgi:outer membrane protein TolC
MIAYPVFTGGARSSAVSRAGAFATAAREEVRLSEMQTREAVDRALGAVEAASSRTVAVTRAVEHLSEVTRIERLALDAGAGTQTEYLRAEADLLTARASLIEARHTTILARVELARIVGELSPDWLAHALENAP